MAQRVRRPHRGQSPSSVTQLPILTALHARIPTLFAPIIHHPTKKVNSHFILFLEYSQQADIPLIFVRHRNNIVLC